MIADIKHGIRNLTVVGKIPAVGETKMVATEFENAFVGIFKDQIELNIGNDGRIVVLSRS